MKCPKCQTENPEESRFCRKCGSPTETDILCPNCGSTHPPDSNFCNKCGHDLNVSQKTTPVSASEPTSPLDDKTLPTSTELEGERKHVTVLFSDMSGYTAMSERLDPEDVKEIMSRIFGRISKVIGKYEGFIEMFIGDAVMAIFGVPKAHEDDPVRAIKTAIEIHELVANLSPQMETKIGRPLSMHSGINTGLVVTGEAKPDLGIHGLTGDAINIASRLQDLAKAGEILVGYETYRQTEGYFEFEELEAAEVKGKETPVSVYRMISPKDKPVTVHRLSGLRSDLIGRKREMALLREAVEKLHHGKGSVFSICGDAGTGKSRLVEEFKASLDLEDILWLEGHAYPYSQNIPYYPLIDLLNRALQIEESDSFENVREKVETWIERLLGKKDIVPFVGSLFSLHYPELEDMSPDFLKFRLQEATQSILSAMAQRNPTIFFLEDLHWASPSFVELLRRTLLELRQPAIVLCSYRPEFSLFTWRQLESIGKIYQEIRLQDLSPSHTLHMLGSLLETDSVPYDLKKLVQEKAEGNPFYLEELVNSLIESETLMRDNGNWKITRSINRAEISPTIHGLITGRLDRLEQETKQILQEASVIGRAFFYEILKKITDLEENVDSGLEILEGVDLIRIRALQPDLEYMFKHPLTQEVVYNGLLKKDRRAIHEQIALVMEQLFMERLPEFYETLAFHFKQGHSTHKAVEYLMKSAEKSAKRNAVQESHQYYKEAFDLLTAKTARTKEEDGLLIDVIIDWAFVFSYRGDFKGLDELLEVHMDLARSLRDKKRLGAFYGWVGVTLWFREKYKDSYQILRDGLKFGEESGSQEVIGEVCTWLCYVGAELGLLEEAIRHGKRAHAIAKSLGTDHWLYIKSLHAVSYVYSIKGHRHELIEAGKDLLDYGDKHSYIRGLVLGHCAIGWSHLIDGNIPAAIESFEEGARASGDPMYFQVARVFLGIGYVLNGQIDEAQDVFQGVISFSREFGVEFIGTPAEGYLGVVSIAEGDMSQGLRMIREVSDLYLEIGRKFWLAMIEYTLGKMFLQIVEGKGPGSLSTIFKNIGFLIKNVPFAGKKAETHFNRAIEIAKEIGASGVLGQFHLDLALLNKSKGRTDKAKKCLSEAITVFEECEAEFYLKQAKEALASLK